MKYKLMILGAGINQLPLIKKAAAAGLSVITVDYQPENIGHQYAHRHLNCSTIDFEGVLAAAERYGIDGIITVASDVAVATIGYVNDRLGLKGVSFKTAVDLTNKGLFRSLQKKHHLNSSSHVTGCNFAELESTLSSLRPPLVFKPVDSSGSRGITIVDGIDFGKFRKAFAYAQQFSKSRYVCVEEYIDGVDVSGDGFMVDGRLVALVTQKHTRGFVPIGHTIPTNIPSHDVKRVLDEVKANCLAFNYLNGPLDFDVRLSAEQVTVIEMSPRLGGNGIPMLIEYATGVDVLTTSIQYALGQEITIPASFEVDQRCSSWIFGSNTRGTLINIAPAEDMKRLIPQIFAYLVNTENGGIVSPFVNSGDSLGYVLFSHADDTPYQTMIDQIEKKMNLTINPRSQRQKEVA
ncbi:MAG: ATP-grasp domain-containing protein [Ardenticatenaceae bacterium]|nr:ATP-grasp domain-containing protein [Ardenticatenaceae bacterium]